MTVFAAQVTSFYAGLTGLLVLYLAYRVTMYRKSNRVGMGDNGDKAFSVAIRAHANAVEYAPISLLLLLMAELNGLGSLGLHVFGAMIFLGRAAHAYGFVFSGGTTHPGRFWGILSNWLAIIGLALLAIGLPVARGFA